MIITVLEGRNDDQYDQKAVTTSGLKKLIGVVHHI